MPGMLIAPVQTESKHSRTKRDRTGQFQDIKSRKKSQNNTGKFPRQIGAPKIGNKREPFGGIAMLSKCSLAQTMTQFRFLTCQVCRDMEHF